MKYFIDTEFLEGTQSTWWGGKTKPTIDLISVALVCEDGRDYYAISNEFNLKEAWNRYDLQQVNGDARNLYPEGRKVYWIRDNVLKAIWNEYKQNVSPLWDDKEFNYKNFKTLIKYKGKSNEQIAEDIIKFTKPLQNMVKTIPNHLACPEQMKLDCSKPQFYGYYSDYDWVAFCWLFGRMMNLPGGFPMYCIDLKQVMDEIAEKWRVQKIEIGDNYSFEHCLKVLKGFKTYPTQENEHSALSDARWNKKLYDFLQTI